MKLIRKINYNFISIAILIIFVGGVIFYIMLRKLMLDQNDNQLIESKTLIEQKFEQFLQNPNQYVWKDGLINVSIHNKPYTNLTSISDTLINISGDENLSAYRKIDFLHKYNDRYYRVKIFKELKFTDNLTLNIIMLVGGLVIFFTITFILVFRLIVKSSLTDFFNTVKKIESFKIDEPESLKFNNSDIDEFENLNEVLTVITNKIQKDYQNLKEFTENASHEIQTPLAIIQNKIEQLIQCENLNEKQMKSFSDILDATSRLSKLNRGLNQLVKIESGHYVKVEDIDLRSIICKNIQQLDDMLASREISVEKDFRNSINIKMDSNLVELLIFNLLKNAMMHNIKGGVIRVSVSTDANRLVISNTGKGDALQIDKLFNRFVKGTNSNSLGLGLAIVQKICKNYDIKLSYNFENGFHSIILDFK